VLRYQVEPCGKKSHIFPAAVSPGGVSKPSKQSCRIEIQRFFSLAGKTYAGRTNNDGSTKMSAADRNAHCLAHKRLAHGTPVKQRKPMPSTRSIVPGKSLLSSPSSPLAAGFCSGAPLPATTWRELANSQPGKYWTSNAKPGCPAPAKPWLQSAYKTASIWRQAPGTSAHADKRKTTSSSL